MAKPKIIARSQRRERMSVDNGEQWKEYRVRRVTEKQFYAWLNAGLISCRFQPYAIEYRYIRTDNGVETVHDWEIWNFGPNANKLINQMLGDSDFLHAESLQPIHAYWVRYTVELTRLGNVAYNAAETYSAAIRAYDEYTKAANREYDKETEGKSVEAAERTKQRMLVKHQPTADRLRSAKEQAWKESRAAQEAYDSFKNSKRTLTPDNEGS